MHYRTLFPSRFLCAEDLRDSVVPLVIERIAIEEMPGDGESRPVLYFRGARKGLVCNKTNAKRIAQMYGAETDGWIGKEILVYPSETDLRGETVPCIRIKLVEPPARAKPIDRDYRPAQHRRDPDPPPSDEPAVPAVDQKPERPVATRDTAGPDDADAILAELDL